MDIQKKILTAANTLFSKYGVRSVTMDDIARHITVSKKTLYQYFNDKDHIVSEAMGLHMERMMDEYAEIFDKNMSAIEELREISKCFRRSLMEVNPSLLFDLQKYHADAWDKWQGYKKSFVKNSILKNIVKGQKEGYYRGELDAEIIAVFRMEQVEISFNDNVYPREQFDFKQVQLMLFDHFAHGLLTNKGLELYQQIFKETKSSQ